MLKEIYLAIQARLMGGNIGIRHFDWFNNQYEDDNSDGFLTDAVFIEFSPIQPRSVANGIQMADVVFRLHHVSDRTRHSQYGLPEQGAALGHLDLINKVNQLIHGYNYRRPADPVAGTPEQQIFNTCSRTDITPDHNQSNLIVNIQEYKTVAFDHSGVKPMISARPKQALTYLY